MWRKGKHGGATIKKRGKHPTGGTQSFSEDAGACGQGGAGPLSSAVSIFSSNLCALIHSMFEILQMLTSDVRILPPYFPKEIQVPIMWQPA